MTRLLVAAAALAALACGPSFDATIYRPCDQGTHNGCSNGQTCLSDPSVGAQAFCTVPCAFASECPADIRSGVCDGTGTCPADSVLVNCDSAAGSTYCVPVE